MFTNKRLQLIKRIPLKAVLELDAKTILGEGATWHPTEQKLYWVDIEGMALHIYDPVTKINRTLPTGSRTGCVVPVECGGAIVALEKGLHSINTTSARLDFLINPLEEGIRFNDGKCDPSGRFWVGSMALDQREGAAALYRFDKDQTIHKMLDNVTISNGIAWSADKKHMYFVDSPTNCIFVFDYDDASGNISNRRTLVHIPADEGSPDGMTIDANGNLWTALWGGNAVACWHGGTGKMIEKIEVPAPHVSCCTFGGADLQTLYITTAREGMSEEQLEKYPHSGGLFSVQPNVKGVPATLYKGKL